MGTMKKVEKLLSKGKSPKEVIGMGFAHSTVYAVAKKVKRAKKIFEVGLHIYDLIEQMAQWIEVLFADSKYSDGATPVPCLHCAKKGEADFMMKLNKKKDRFECPRCGMYLLNAGHLSLLSTIYLVEERIKRGEKPPGVA